MVLQVQDAKEGADITWQLTTLCYELGILAARGSVAQHYGRLLCSIRDSIQIVPKEVHNAV